MSSTAFQRRRLLATVLAVTLAASALTLSAGPPVTAAETHGSVDSYAPNGTTNVARAATATAHSSQDAWPPSRLVDGDAGTAAPNLWVADETGASEGGWVKLDFSQPEPVERIVVFPRGDTGMYGAYFPIKYTASLIDGAGETVWSTEIAHPDAWEVVVAPDVIDLDTAVTAVSLRLDVTKRQSREGGVLQLSEVAVFANSTTVAPGAPPAGTENLALDATAQASSSYEMPGETWAAALAHDGLAGTANGWSTNPYDKTTDPNTPATLTLDLTCAADIQQLVVFPRQKNFPQNYRMQTSVDGDEWTTVGTSTGNPSAQAEPQAFTVPSGTLARFVRILVDVRNGPDGGDGYLVQLSELSVFGQRETCIDQVKPALLLRPGATEESWFTIRGPAVPFAASSSDRSVATVNAHGAITAVGIGQATVTLATDSTTLTVPVEVSDEIERIGDDFTITAFWPPTIDHLNDEQYDNLANAGIDVVQNAQVETSSRAGNLEMARLAHERGMQIIVQDSTAGALPTMTAEQVAGWTKQYTNVPGVGGLYLVDEPSNATQYATAFKTVRQEAPTLYPHLNFLPYGAYGGEEANDRAMRDWLDASGPRTMDDPDYLMYDLYPFQAGGTNFEGMFTNLNTVRELGLERTVKTATYLQSVGIPGGLRRPVPAEIRYEANVAMAYGYKQLSYFTWWTPTNRSEPFTDAIMTADGQKTDLYEPVKQFNSEIHALGPTLMGLDATEVYLTGNTYGQATVPSDFVVQSEGGGDLVLSRMTDRESGERYLFVVNNSYSSGQDVRLRFDDSVTALREVSRVDGALGDAVPLTDGILSSELGASEGVLYLLVDDEATEPVTPVEPPIDPKPSGPVAEVPSSNSNTAQLGATGLEVGVPLLVAGLLLAGGAFLTVRAMLRRRLRTRND